MIERNKRRGHFLWICRRLGQSPADLAGTVRSLKQGGTASVGGGHAVKLVMVRNTPDGRLYVLDVYAGGRLIRRSPCFIDPPRRGRRVRMVTEITGAMLLIGLTLGGVGVAHYFGDNLAGTLAVQESCGILRFDVFYLDADSAYYVVEVQNDGTTTGEFDVRLKAEGQIWEQLNDPQEMAEFEAHVWSGTQRLGIPTDKGSVYLAEASAPDGGALCTAKTASK